MKKLVTSTLAAALMAGFAFAITLGAGNAFADDDGVVLVKCQEKLNFGDPQRDVTPQVYQFQASAGIAQPASCIRLPNADFPEIGAGPAGPRSCAQCLGDLKSGADCEMLGSPVVVMLADPGRGEFRFRSIEKYVLLCDKDDD